MHVRGDTVEFGFIVVTAPSDWLFGKGCIASLRYFMPDVPTTLLVDGDVDTSAAERHFSIRIIRRADVKDAWLRAKSFGWAITKMVAHWESPYSHFVAMDSDMVAWGNVLDKLCRIDVDFLWSTPHSGPTEPIESHLSRWFFEPQALQTIAPTFNWRTYVNNYSCPGIYMARRGCLSKSRYMMLTEEQANRPNLFKFGDMGMLNFMVFEMVARGEAQIAFDDFQVIFPDHDRGNLEQRFRITGASPLVNGEDRQVLHMTDAKPVMDNPACYSAPMTFFRLEYLAATEGLKGDAALAVLRSEDQAFHAARKARLNREWRRKVTGLLRGEVGAWRRLASRLTSRA
jgi:hypothetical protein